MRPLTCLSEDFNVPPTHDFNFGQLFHDFKSQFPRTSLNMVESELEQALRTECAEKPTSHLYAHLVMAALFPLEKLRGKWLRAILHLDNDDWDDIWDLPCKTLVSTPATLPRVMEVCLLGLIETLVPTIAKCTLAGILLFYARKNIAMQWKKPNPPPLCCNGNVWSMIVSPYIRKHMQIGVVSRNTIKYGVDG